MHHDLYDHIGTASAEDAPRIREIMELSILALPHPDWFVDDDIPYILRHIEKEGYILCYRASLEEEKAKETVLAGYLLIRFPGSAPDNLGQHLHLDPSAFSRVAHVESVCVDPAFRGRRIFAKLLSSAINRERQNGRVDYLMATVHPENLYSRNVLTGAGFRPIETLPKYGNRIRTVMALPLTEEVQP